MSQNEHPNTTGLRERSGNYTTEDRLIQFIYLLARDAVPLGQIEKIMREIQANPRHATFSTALTNGHLAQWAADVAERLRI